MKKSSLNPSSSHPLSRGVLEETPNNALAFLNGATNQAILHQLQSGGYTKADHMEGWKLLLRVGTVAVAAPVVVENQAAKAVAEIEAWVVPGFQRARAVWQRKFPEVEQFVFNDVHASRGPGAVLACATFLERCAALHNAADRKSTRKNDHAALDALSQRGITSAVLKHMATLVTTAQSQPETPEPVLVPQGEAERVAAVTDLYLWLRDWRETARAIIKNRAQLIHLGIGRRRTTKGALPVAPQPPVTVTPAPPATVATPPQLPPANGATANHAATDGAIQTLMLKAPAA